MTYEQSARAEKACKLLDQISSDLDNIAAFCQYLAWPSTHTTFALGDLVSKRRGSSWHGRIVGWYSTKLTPEGYAVESLREPGSVQIYPAAALQKWSPYQPLIETEPDLECFRNEDPTT